jgi:hypothetical protein
MNKTVLLLIPIPLINWTARAETISMICRRVNEVALN